MWASPGVALQRPQPPWNGAPQLKVTLPRGGSGVPEIRVPASLVVVVVVVPRPGGGGGGGGGRRRRHWGQRIPPPLSLGGAGTPPPGDRFALSAAALALASPQRPAVLNASKVWVSAARPPLAVCGELLRTARLVLEGFARPAPLPPAPLPFGEEHGFVFAGVPGDDNRSEAGGGQGGGGGAATAARKHSELALMATGAPSWGAAVQGVGDWAAVRSAAAFQDLALDCAELQRVALGSLQHPGGGFSSAPPMDERGGGGGAGGSGGAGSGGGGGSGRSGSAVARGAGASGGAPVAYGGASGVRFYLALANLLAVHATAALGRCCTLADLRGDAVGARVAYDVGGETLTLCEVLRRARGRSRAHRERGRSQGARLTHVLRVLACRCLVVYARACAAVGLPDCCGRPLRSPDLSSGALGITFLRIPRRSASR